ncbi:MAG: NUDIX domain-containing protein [Bacteroidia bacterium]|nr:NUDIX domain-containing protein [Bacteroidia bacterium]
MNRKIYFNDKFIEFIEPGSQSSQNQDFKFFQSIQNEKDLKKALAEFLDPGKTTNLFVYNIKFSEALRLLKNDFHYIEAAGGFIEKQNEFLFIRRHNRWDLPKGKLEKNEGIKEAAVRECEEECGIKRLTILKELPSTFHIYPFKNAHALKQSYWFYMTTDYSEKLVPQVEESITEVRWFSRKEIESEILKDTYYTIRDVTLAGLG